MKCIYCLEERSCDYFKKKEHVLPQAFGLFKNNFTLNGIVCDVCNKHFGDHLEISLSRDTIEGLSRFEYSVKNQKEFKSPGKKSRLTVKINEGMYKLDVQVFDWREGGS